MGRKPKVGIDYFSHDVDMMNDKKIKILKSRNGLIGYAIYLRLLEELFRDQGYYLEIDDDFNELFVDDNNININVYIKALNDCINVNLFNKVIYDEYKILTSKRIQLNYLSATERRTKVDINEKFVLFNYINDNINNKNVYINGINVYKSTQSKLNKIKVNKKKVEHIDDEQPMKVLTNLIENNLWIMKSLEFQTLGMMVEESGFKIVEKAIKIGIMNHCNNLNYIDKILLNWKEKKLDTIQKVDEYISNYSNKQKGKGLLPKDIEKPEWMEGYTKEQENPSLKLKEAPFYVRHHQQYADLKNITLDEAINTNVDTIRKYFKENNINLK